MNEIVLLGVAMFFAAVGIALMGSDNRPWPAMVAMAATVRAAMAAVAAVMIAAVAVIIVVATVAVAVVG